MGSQNQIEGFIAIQFDENFKILQFDGDSHLYFNIPPKVIPDLTISDLFCEETVTKIKNSFRKKETAPFVIKTKTGYSLKLHIPQNSISNKYEVFLTDVSDLQLQIDNLKNLVENATDAIIFGDLGNMNILVNQTAVELTGYSKKDFQNMVVNDLFPDDVLEQEPLRYDLITAGQTVTKIRNIRRKDGKIITIEMKSKVLDDGRLLSIMRDLSGQITLANRLQESEERYKTVFENVPLGIFNISPESVIIDCNDIFCQLLGSSKEKLIGFNMLKRLQDEKMKNAVKKMLKTGKGTFEGDYSAITSGKTVPVRVLFNAIRDKKGDILCGVGIVEDISERKKYEKEIIEAREKAESADKLKSHFLAQVSHEIRTPINTILSFSGLLREELEGKLSDDLSLSFKAIKIAGDRITRTIDQIINMSQIKAGAFETFPRQIQLHSDILQPLFREYQIHAIKKNLGFELITKNSDLKVFGDEYTIGQIVANLIDNAIKYTQNGKIIINLCRNNGNVIIEVTDTGIGISEEYLESIFEPFSQEEQGYTRKFEGNGLGLSLVKNYCELNEAKLEISSKKDKGSTFRVIFNSLN